jgi:short-chain Z-isoprenyl diphosphate synthase
VSWYELPGQQRASETAPNHADAKAKLGLSAITSLIYRLYEIKLLKDVQNGRMPRHVGIILDGNRRYGRRLRLSDARQIYRLGAHKLDEVLAWCSELRIPAITLWALSIDNLRRPESELSSILSAIEEKIHELTVDPEVHRRGIRIRAVGRLHLLPRSTLAVLNAAEAATQTNRSMTLTIAVAYGGRHEIADAVREMLRDQASHGQTVEAIIEQVTPEAIANHLYAVDLPEPELIIRTSGEIRLSGFLLWQSAYSEFYFSDVNWPAFRKIDFLRAIRDFQSRDRKFGL